jgi:hypothetical protein
VIAMALTEGERRQWLIGFAQGIALHLDRLGHLS